MIKIGNIRIYQDIEFSNMEELNKFRSELTAALEKVIPPNAKRAVNFTYTNTDTQIKTIQEIK